MSHLLYRPPALLFPPVLRRLVGATKIKIVRIEQALPTRDSIMVPLRPRRQNHLTNRVRRDGVRNREQRVTVGHNPQTKRRRSKPRAKSMREGRWKMRNGECGGRREIRREVRRIGVRKGGDVGGERRVKVNANLVVAIGKGEEVEMKMRQSASRLCISRSSISTDA